MLAGRVTPKATQKLGSEMARAFLVEQTFQSVSVASRGPFAATTDWKVCRTIGQNSEPCMPGTLYLVATPIGNLKDITFRAVETLRLVDVIACEDTRHTRKLLNALEIQNKLVSYHEYNESDRADELGKRLESGGSVAVVSDAGTPGINDPGFRLIRKAVEIGSVVIPIPGAVAFVNAVVVSGLPTDSILFGGFLPSKASERRKRLSEFADLSATLVFYESPAPSRKIACRLHRNSRRPRGRRLP